MPSASKDAMLGGLPKVGPGVSIRNKWLVGKKLGEGSFGEIFEVRDILPDAEGGEPARRGHVRAVKIEYDKKDRRGVLKTEALVLKRLQPLPTVARFYYFAAEEAVPTLCGYRFMVMERLGANLSERKKESVDKRLGVRTALQIGMQTVRALEGLHNAGFVHRDVKPSNFATGHVGSARRKVYMLDFGLARKYRAGDGSHRPPRDKPGFRGTTRYASINAHLDKDLSRRDDLWSVLYMLVEFLNGSLPWSRIKSKDEVASAKMYIDGPELVEGLPPCLLAMMQHLNTLNFADRPDYDGLVAAMREGAGCGPDEEPFEWDAAAYTDRTEREAGVAGKKNSGSGAKRDDSNTLPNNNSNNNNNNKPGGHDGIDKIGGAGDGAGLDVDAGGPGAGANGNRGVNGRSSAVAAAPGNSNGASVHWDTSGNRDGENNVDADKEKGSKGSQGTGRKSSSRGGGGEDGDGPPGDTEAVGTTGPEGRVVGGPDAGSEVNSVSRGGNNGGLGTGSIRPRNLSHSSSGDHDTAMHVRPRVCSDLERIDEEDREDEPSPRPANRHHSNEHDHNSNNNNSNNNNADENDGEYDSGAGTPARIQSCGTDAEMSSAARETTVVSGGVTLVLGQQKVTSPTSRRLADGSKSPGGHSSRSGGRRSPARGAATPLARKATRTLSNASGANLVPSAARGRADSAGTVYDSSPGTSAARRESVESDMGSINGEGTSSNQPSPMRTRRYSSLSQGSGNTDSGGSQQSRLMGDAHRMSGAISSASTPEEYRSKLMAEAARQPSILAQRSRRRQSSDGSTSSPSNGNSNSGNETLPRRRVERMTSAGSNGLPAIPEGRRPSVVSPAPARKSNTGGK